MPERIGSYLYACLGLVALAFAVGLTTDNTAEFTTRFPWLTATSYAASVAFLVLALSLAIGYLPPKPAEPPQSAEPSKPAVSPMADLLKSLGLPALVGVVCVFYFSAQATTDRIKQLDTQVVTGGVKLKAQEEKLKLLEADSNGALKRMAGIADSLRDAETLELAKSLLQAVQEKQDAANIINRAESLFAQTFELSVKDGKSTGFTVPPRFVGHIYVHGDTGNSSGVFVVGTDANGKFVGNAGFAKKPGVSQAIATFELEDDQGQLTIRCIHEPSLPGAPIQKLKVTLVGQVETLTAVPAAGRKNS